MNTGPVGGPSAGFHLLLATVTGLQRQAPILPFLRNLPLFSQQPPNSRLEGCLSSPAQSCAAWKCYREIFINIFGSVRTREGSIDLSGDARAGAIQASSGLGLGTHTSFEFSLQSKAVMFKRGGTMYPVAGHRANTVGKGTGGTQPWLEEPPWEDDEETSASDTMCSWDQRILLRLHSSSSQDLVFHGKQPKKVSVCHGGQSWESSQVALSPKSC